MFTERLRQLRRELADDDRAGVLELTDPTINALETTRAEEAAYDKITQHVRASGDGDVRPAVEEYLGAAAQAEEQRAAAIQAVLGYLGGDASSADAASAVDDAIDAERRLETATDDLGAAKRTVSVPPILSVTGPDALEVPKGTAVSESYTVSNLGTEPASAVSASVAADPSLSVSPARVGKLDPDASATVTLDGTPTAEGTHTVRLSATAGDVGDVLVVTAVVADKADYLDRALDQIDALQRTVSGVREGAGGKGKGKGKGNGNGANGLRGVESKLRSVEGRLQKLASRLERGNGAGRSVNDAIGAAIDTLEAAENQLGGLRPQQISAGDATLLTGDIEATVTTLHTAQEADP